MFEQSFVSHSPTPGAISILNAPIISSDDDYQGIRIALDNLATDFSRVTGGHPNALISQRPECEDYAIVVGSLEKSSLIKDLVASGKINVGKIKGQWESYVTKLVDDPWDGCKKALVICGSDKRGTIFGIYELSEQIGVSPWYWWADVPVKQSSEIYALDVETHAGPPTVKYRGIFINDEAPALSGWVHEKFGPKYNSAFYVHVFELLLRLKANFLWPAMWFGFPHPGSSFFMDDPGNQALADKYGIVVGTSHHEPMQRAMNEWFDKPYHMPEKSWRWIKEKDKITQYFREGSERAKGYESVITMGMRGDGDREMDVENPEEVLKEVLETQRGIIKDTYGKEDDAPQLIALYKEVQEYYENGLKIPEDMTLLFADDNFGSIRRLPTSEERKRKGGAGIYYHLEYVGEPRSYKWLNSNSLAKVYQQLSLANRRGANQIWIFNVGDIKPLEVPLSFVMALAWNIDSVPRTHLLEFFEKFFEQTFGKDLAPQCADLLIRYDKLVTLRKHEHIEPETFSLLNYREADTILQRWKILLADAEALYKEISLTLKSSFFQVVLHPIKASTIYVSLQISRAKNALYAKQRRTSANQYFDFSISLFKQDFQLSQEFHSLLDGKWNHIMRQPHLGYRETWHAPSRDMISGLCLVQAGQDSNPMAGHIGVAVEGHEGVRPGLCNEESDRTHPTRRDGVPGVTLPVMEPFGPKRYFDLYSRSSRVAKWTIASPVEWVRVDPPEGVIAPNLLDHDTRVGVSVNWSKVDLDFNDEVLLLFESDLGDYEHIHIPIINRSVPKSFVGHVESDGHVSIPAAKFSNPSLTGLITDHYLGREQSGAVYFLPQVDGTQSFNLEYPFWTFTPASNTTISLCFTLTLDTDPTSPLTYNFSLNDSLSQSHALVRSPNQPGELPPDWSNSVMDCVWVRKHEVDLSKTGAHVLRIELISKDGNMGLEKIVVDLGGVRPSYLGPPESFYLDSSDSQ